MYIYIYIYGWYTIIYNVLLLLYTYEWAYSILYIYIYIVCMYHNRSIVCMSTYVPKPRLEYWAEVWEYSFRYIPALSPLYVYLLIGV